MQPGLDKARRALDKARRFLAAPESAPQAKAIAARTSSHDSATMILPEFGRVRIKANGRIMVAES